MTFVDTLEFRFKEDTNNANIILTPAYFYNYIGVENYLCCYDYSYLKVRQHFVLTFVTKFSTVFVFSMIMRTYQNCLSACTFLLFDAVCTVQHPTICI